MSAIEDKTDELVVASVAAGDTDAFGEIMTRYEAKLHRYVVYLIHDEPMAHDVVQETFIKAYQNLRSFNPKYKFSSWIYRIAHNEAINMIKREKHIVREVEIENIHEASYETSTIEDIDQAILRGDVTSCLDRLDVKYREVLMLQFYENMKYSEIADVLHIPISTVGVWAARGKNMLRKICAKKGIKP